MTPSEPVKQHLITQALLRRFTNESGLLKSQDLQFGGARLRSPGAVGYRPNFISHDAQKAEALWGEVEGGLPQAFDALDNGTVFDTPGASDTLKSMIALHFMRRDQVRAIADRIFDGVPAMIRVPKKFRGQRELTTALVAQGLEADRSEMFSENLRGNFLKAQQRALRSGLEVHHSAEPLLIGDGAVLSVMKGKIGFVPFGQAGSHLMPAGRHHIIAFGPRDEMAELPAHTAREFNRHQTIQAQRHVFYCPHDPLESFVREIRTQSWEDGPK